MRSQRNPIPGAFLCYTHFDDKHNQGQLTEFRKLLSAEVRAQTGEEFFIFQDRDSIEWGQNWEERIKQTLNETTFLIPVVTPSFFTSSECRKELQAFLARERQLNRTDLILPLYYIEAAVIEDEAKREIDEAVKAISSHQWADWRELRFDSISSVAVRRRVAELAAQIRNALAQAQNGIITNKWENLTPEPDKGRKGWYEFEEAMDKLTALSGSIFPSFNKHIQKMNESLEKYEQSATPILKKRNLSLAASQLRNGARIMEEKLPAVSEIIDDATGYILGFASRRNPHSETDREQLSEFRKQLIKVTKSHKPQLEVAQQMRYKVLKLGDLGQEMDGASQRMAKAFMAFLAPFQKFQEDIDRTIKEIDGLLSDPK